MKITKRQLRKIIKEEIERATEGLTYSQHGQESGPEDDQAVWLKGYQADQAGKEKVYPPGVKGKAGLEGIYDAGYEEGLKELLDDGVISQEEYDKRVS